MYSPKTHMSHISADDDPLYDSVASDEDYAQVPENSEQVHRCLHFVFIRSKRISLSNFFQYFSSSKAHYLDVCVT